MDYEKMYKEALERAKGIIKYYKEHNRGDEAAIEDLETTFPELRESEGERIRAQLIEYFKAYPKDYFGGLKKSHLLAWLEKQGTSYTKKDVDNAYLEGMAFAKNELEKQNKQKPFFDFKAKDWYVSEVDGKIHNIYNSVDKVEPKFKVKYAGSEYSVLEVKDTAGVTFYGIEDELNHIDYVKAENCEIIGGYAMKENGSPYPTKPAVFSEQKTAAWSEEDEKMLNSIIEDFGDGKTSNMLQEHWLKSLKGRCTWKPTEKQMAALEYYMYALSATEHKEILFGLYNDLKKLTE